MSKGIVAPIYAQIALDIAVRISKGALKENTKVHGRSVMSSEYGVSPETIRRAMKLLEDVGVVENRPNSGTVILSAQKAKDYAEKLGEQNDVRVHQKKLIELLTQQNDISRRIAEISDSIVRINQKFTTASPFSSYEVRVQPTSKVLGKTIGEVMFWQNTSATIIAIRRRDSIILSPGPYAIFEADDTVVFVGDVKCAETVYTFING